MSRDISKMCPELREKYNKWKIEMEKVNLPFIITCVDRSIIEQMALFVQGRLGLTHVNVFRKKVGLYLLTSEENNIITWTLNSKHITNEFDSDKTNDFSEAFDFALLKENRVHWNLKVDANKDFLMDYLQAGKIWESLGGVAGYTFNDYCHLQI